MWVRPPVGQEDRKKSHPNHYFHQDWLFLLAGGTKPLGVPPGTFLFWHFFHIFTEKCAGRTSCRAGRPIKTHPNHHFNQDMKYSLNLLRVNATVKIFIFFFFVFFFFFAPTRAQIGRSDLLTAMHAGFFTSASKNKWPKFSKQKKNRFCTNPRTNWQVGPPDGHARLIF